MTDEPLIDPSATVVLKWGALGFIVVLLAILWAVSGMFAVIVGLLISLATALFFAALSAEEEGHLDTVSRCDAHDDDWDEDAYEAAYDAAFNRYYQEEAQHD